MRITQKLNNYNNNQTCKVLSIGTQSISVSYIFLFLKALLSTIRRNVCLSIAHKEPSDAAWIVAALGILYNKANSPKLPLFSYVWINFGCPWLSTNVL